MDCMLAMPANCFDIIRKMDENDRNDRKEKHESISTGKIMNSLDEQKMFCHPTLKDFKVHTDGEWWKLKIIASIQA